MKTIILHDYFRFMEGGGRLSLILAQYLKADLGYGFKIKNHPFFDVHRIKGKEFDLGVFGYLTGWRNIGLIQAFKNRTGFLKQYNTAVYSGFYAPMAVSNHSEGKNIYYCHTPPRFIYDQREFYLSRYPVWVHPVINSMVAFYQPQYEMAAKKMDCVVTNSNNVKKRIKKYLDLNATVVYPPCETEKFKWIGQEGYYLSAARLDPLKRVDVIVEAFKKMPDKRLVVISGGPEAKLISKNARKFRNIEFLGNVSDKLYHRLLGECIATIYIPKDEDFGMTPIESMAAGKPVIGVRAGGLVESIEHNETGILIPPTPVKEDVIEAVEQLDKRNAKIMMSSCQKRAKQFDVNIFISKISEILN
jgi:glycosyltransferase involved in cell wall biosynthesis